jgi:hypothetical protein
MMLTDLDVGPAGDVIAGGLAAGPVPVVYKLSGPTGAELWQSTPGGAQDKGGVVDLEVTPGGFVYGTGYITSSEDPSRERILAFRLDSQGQVDWLKRIGPGADDGIGLALALDHSAYQNPLQGHLYLTGDVVYPGPEQDMTLVRLRTLDGWGAGYIPPFMWRLLPISLRLEVLWLGKYEDRRELEEEIAAALAAEPAMRDFVWTRSAPDLLLHADRQVILGPLDEEEEVVAIEWIRCHQERLQAERQAAAFFPLLAGGPGEMLATRYFESEERPPGGAR